MSGLPKIIVILGPTASGKTGLSLRLAKKFNGEIISADSRQIYKKMNIGTVKPPGMWQEVDGQPAYLVEDIPHYMMDIVDPGQELSLAEFKEQATHCIGRMLARGKMPFIVGGTGLYIFSVVDNLLIPQIVPNKKLRRSLEQKPIAELQKLLQRFDPASAAQIDRNNPRRVIRALEVSLLSGESFVGLKRAGPTLYESLQIGISWTLPELYERINGRADGLIKQGLVAETQALLKQKYSLSLPSMSGIGYRQIGDYLRGACTLEEALVALERATRQYARRQMTWFRRDQRIQWVEGRKMEEEAERLIGAFIY